MKTRKLRIGNVEFNAIVDDSVPIGTVIFQDPKTGKEVGRIVNIDEGSEDPINIILTGAYKAAEVIQQQ